MITLFSEDKIWMKEKEKVVLNITSTWGIINTIRYHIYVLKWLQLRKKTTEWQVRMQSNWNSLRVKMKNDATTLENTWTVS